MTIVYRSFGPTTNTAYLDALSALLDAAGRDLGTVIRAAGLREAQFTTKQFRAFHPRDTHRLLGEIYQDQRHGAACVVIGNIQDPGLYEARQVCDIPVVGLLESTVMTLRPYGAAVGLLASDATVVPLLRERLRQYQATGSVSGIEVCGIPLAGWAQAFTDDQARVDAVDTVMAAARRAAAAGAELVVPASGIAAALLATAWGNASAWRPDPAGPIIVNPIYVTVAYGVMAMNLHASGLRVSRLGTYVAPQSDDLEELFGGGG